MIYPFLKDHPIVESYPKINGLIENYLFFEHDF